MSIAGEVSGTAAAETGLRPGIVAAAISAGGTVITTVDSPLHAPRIHTLRHAYKDRWLMMGAT